MKVGSYKVRVHKTGFIDPKSGNNGNQEIGRDAARV